MSRHRRTETGRTQSRRRRTITAAISILLTLVVIAGAIPSPAAAAVDPIGQGDLEARLASQLTWVINQSRVARSLPALRTDRALQAIATWRSRDMARRSYFTHAIPPSGRLVFSELDRRGYCYEVAGENIGWNVKPAPLAARAIHAMFLASPKHRAIELGRWSRIAVAVATSIDGKRYWTVLFSTPCA